MKTHWFQRTFFPFMGVIGLLSMIVITFWWGGFRYLLPTPIPKGYQVIALGDSVSLEGFVEHRGQKPIFLHFFNPQCPCSRFNMQHFAYLYKRYKNQISFYTVLPGKSSQEAILDFQNRYSLNIPVILDNKEALASACGVYSTPQAAIIQRDGALYYRGNYNRSRYCVNQAFNFANMAIDSLLAVKPAPYFQIEATQSYGCSLPSQDSLRSSHLSFWLKQ